MKKKYKGNSIFWAMLKMNILPIVLLAIVLTSFSAVRFASAMNQEVQNGLIDLSNTIFTMYDVMYEGDYHVITYDGSIYLFKGEHQLNGDYEIIDAIKEKSDVDVTVFYQDVRVLTTVYSKSGERAIGTRASAVARRDVLEGKKAQFYSNVLVEDEKYFAYYAPIIDSKGECVGMLFVGKPSSEVEELVWKSVRPIVYFAVVIGVAAGFLTVRFSRKMIAAIERTGDFVAQVSGGDLHAELSMQVLKREDELGDMGKNVVQMQKALCELVELDQLTGLNNRRNGEKLLRQVHLSCKNAGRPYCVAIGDIDFFKKINDTYGHECGDVVLSEISARIKAKMQGQGFAARWGGEEFLLVFQNMELAAAYRQLSELLEDIRTRKVQYKNCTEVQVTMTFGVVQGGKSSAEQLLRDADARLYQGKNNGRDQVVQ